MKKESIKWSCKMKLEKYFNDESLRNNKPDEVIDITGNTALIGGLETLWKLVTGAGDNVDVFPFDTSNAYIGVGDSSVAASPTQSGLLGASVCYRPMDQSTGVIYPQIVENTISFRARFDSTDANFIWNEWGIINGDPENPGTRDVSTIIQLNRRVEPMGTKTIGSTWVIIADITLNP